MEAKNIADTITVGVLGIGGAVLVFWYLKNRLVVSAKAAWSNAPSMAGFMTFCIWLVCLLGMVGLVGGVWAGGRMFLFGATSAVAQVKGK